MKNKITITICSILLMISIGIYANLLHTADKNMEYLSDSTITDILTPQTYLVHGDYYSKDGGTIVTLDGNEWGWTNDDPKHIADGHMVVIKFSDNGTPDNIYDDIIDFVVPNFTNIRYEIGE